MVLMRRHVNGCLTLPPPRKCECMTIPVIPRGACCGEEACCAKTECLPVILPFFPPSVYYGTCPYPLFSGKN